MILSPPPRTKGRGNQLKARTQGRAKEVVTSREEYRRGKRGGWKGREKGTVA